MNGAPDAVGTGVLLRVFLRALLLQAAWSFDRMQSLGFAYAIEPALRKLYPSRVERDGRLKVHLEYFNTQPYFACFILGAAIRLEEDRATGRNHTADVSGLKASLMAPLGALGDSFFWGALKPVAGVAAVAVAMTGRTWAPLLFLALYTAGHLILRLGMLFWGYAGRGDAVTLMARCRFTKRTRRLKMLSLALLGSMLGMLPYWRTEFSPGLPVPAAATQAAGLGCVLFFIAVIRRVGSPVKLMLGLAAFCLALAFAGVV